MAVPQRRASIEVFRLPLRDTVNEGGDDGASSSRGGPLSSLAQQEQSAKPLSVGVDARAAKRVHDFAQRSMSSNSTVCSSVDLEGPSPSSGASGSNRHLLEAEPARTLAPVMEPAPAPLERGDGSSNHGEQRGSARQVVLVSRPSQRDIEMWTERATSTMVRSAGGTLRPISSSSQSTRWMLEYKPSVRHSGWLIKRGHSIRNFKRRLFCIVDNELIYHDSHDASEVRGRIDLSKKSTVQCLAHSGFKFSQGSWSMVLYALDKHDRDVWIKKLQEHQVELLPTGTKTAKLIKRRSDNSVNDPILFSGWLRKRGQVVRTTKRRWFELTGTTLTYYSHPEGGSRKGLIELTKARVTSLDTLKTGEFHSFMVVTPHRNVLLHADSQDERAVWIASISSVAEKLSKSDGTLSRSASSSGHDRLTPGSASGVTNVADIGKFCTCGAASSSEDGAEIDGFCRRCMSSFVSNTEDAMVDVAREVQLILASPYSPEGSTSAAFLREHTGTNVTSATVKKFMTGLADYMFHSRMNELKVLAGHAEAVSSEDSDTDDESTSSSSRDLLTPGDGSSDVEDGIMNIIYDQIEERVFFPLYRTIVDNIRARTREESKLIKGKMEVLRSKPQTFFGISPSCVSPSGWLTACAKLWEIDKVSLPYMKRAQLLAGCKEIYSIYHQEHPSNAPMNADEFIPAFIYVLIHSRMRDPVALKELITFFDGGGTHGEIAYFVTCLEIALEYIRSLVIACTVVLDSSRTLGIEFARDSAADIVVVNRLIEGEQAQQSGAINTGDVLMAINGLPVYEMELAEVVKVWKGVDGDAELCFLPMNEFLAKYGTMR
jgi:hypothetical protein